MSRFKDEKLRAHEQARMNAEEKLERVIRTDASSRSNNSGVERINGETIRRMAEASKRLNHEIIKRASGGRPLYSNLERKIMKYQSTLFRYIGSKSEMILGDFNDKAALKLINVRLDALYSEYSYALDTGYSNIEVFKELDDKITEIVMSEISNFNARQE